MDKEENLGCLLVRAEVVAGRLGMALGVVFMTLGSWGLRQDSALPRRSKAESSEGAATRLNGSNHVVVPTDIN